MQYHQHYVTIGRRRRWPWLVLIWVAFLCGSYAASNRMMTVPPPKPQPHPIVHQLPQQLPPPLPH